MNYILWFLKLRFLILKNILWRDKKTIARTIFIGILIVISQVFLINMVNRLFIKDIFVGDENVRIAVATTFFAIGVGWIYLLCFFDSANNLIRNFYRSPDLNYLITIPVPINYVFMSKFIEYIVKNTWGKLFLVFPVLFAMGQSLSAPWYFYFLIIPFYILISIVPSAAGVIIGMLGVRLLSSKIYSSIIVVFSFVVNMGFFILLGRIESIIDLHMESVLEFFQRPFVMDLFSFTAGIRIFLFAVLGSIGELMLSLSLLILVTGLITVLIFIFAQRFFYTGWSKSQHTEAKIYKNKWEKSYDTKKNYLWNWIKGEWKMAFRNKELLPGCAMFLGGYLIMLIVLIARDIFSNPLFNIYLLMAIASFINVIAVSIPFIPIELATDKNLVKNRYWLLKVMPLKASDVFNIQCTMILVPVYIISFTGIMVYSILNGVGILSIILAGIALALLLCGSVALTYAIDIFVLDKFYDKNKIIGNIIAMVLPITYSILSVGPIILFLIEDFPVSVSFIQKFLNLPIVIIIFVFVTIFSSIVSRKVFVHSWSNMEINN
ncbi:hypothetical protein RBH29_02115 [Herbivorax sp. ANBcel31]|uniref:putative ABC transporter permease subunit n=1 Tax=Herbivorax sp. ANBcel31 TaxID=3069754 RepID=UPI0027B7A1E6|nr:hypothetical protein [Herbivorax sp. ANBcel31]MDQ2085230.1 hypothetical protein [Herbivorax sp. ANBcel31]